MYLLTISNKADKVLRRMQVGRDKTNADYYQDYYTKLGYKVKVTRRKTMPIINQLRSTCRVQR